MRNYLLLFLFLLIPLYGMAQKIKVQDTFFGCEYGCSPKIALQKLEDAKLNIIKHQSNVISIKYPSIGGIAFDFANMFFYNDSFYSIYFVIQQQQENVCLSLLKSIKEKLEKKYQMKYSIEDAFFYQDGVNDVSLYQFPGQIILSYTNMKIRDYKGLQEL